MSSIKSAKLLSHSSATEALYDNSSRPLIKAFDTRNHLTSDADNDSLIRWMQDWKVNLTPSSYIKSTLDSITPSAAALNAVFIAHKFVITAIQMLALDKGAHVTALHLQTILALEIFKTQTNQENQLDIAIKISDTLLKYLSLWSETLGSKGSSSIDEINAILASDHDIERKLKYLEENIDNIFKRLQKTREKLAEMVQGQLTRRECQQQCARALREATHNIKLTTSCAGFLSGPWYDGIQHIYLTEGDKSSVWKNSQTITESIISTFAFKEESEDDRKNQDDSNTADIAKNEENFRELKNTIIRYLDPLLHSDAEHLNWLEELETEYWAKVNGLDVRYVKKLNLPVIDIGDSLEINVSEKLLRKAKSYIEGDWFRFKGNYSGRSQILATSNNGHRYIFNNLNGQKTFEFSIKELAYMLASGDAKQIEQDDITDFLLLNIIDTALQGYDSEEYSSAQSTEKIQARNKATKEADSILKHRQEQLKELAELEKTRASLAQEKSQTAILESKIQRLEMEKLVLQMELGSWIELSENNKKLRLAVKLSSANKYLFTNELGLGRNEFTIDTLIDKLLAQDIKLIEHEER